MVYLTSHIKHKTFGTRAELVLLGMYCCRAIFCCHAVLTAFQVNSAGQEEFRKSKRGKRCPDSLDVVWYAFLVSALSSSSPGVLTYRARVFLREFRL